MRARYRRGLWAAIAGVTVIAVVAVSWVVLGRTTGHRDAGRPDGRVATAAASTTTPVCGFDGPLVGKLTADRPADAEPPALSTWRVGGDGALGAMAVEGDTVVVDRDRKDGTSEFLRFSLDGEPQGRFRLAVKHEGRWTLADDGSLYVVDSYHGSTRRVLHLSPDGARLGSFDVARSRESTGGPLDLENIVWIPQYQGAPALLVGEGEHTVHAIRPSGDDLGVLSDAPDVIGNGLGGALVAGFSDSRGPVPVTTLEVVDLDSGDARLHAVYSDADGDDQGRPTTPAPYHVGSVVPGPGDDGFLLSTAYGVQWIDALGVRKGVWLAGQNGFSPTAPSSMVEAGDRYWMLVKAGDRDSVATLTAAQMRQRLASPMLPTADVEPDLAQLGLGIGAVTHVPFNHFDAGQPPLVVLRAEEGWGELTGAARPSIRVRYTVAGDPTLADPVAWPMRTATIPWGGGETALRVPADRPGPYEVNLEIVDESSGSVLSGSCLHYSIGAPGADLSLGSLAKGDDWGGAAPLRGAQLAAALGIGSHRVQLDFGGLIAHPTSTPSAGGIDWSRLPGANLSDDPDHDPFQNLRAAGEYAAAHGARVIVQVGSGGDAEKDAVTSGTWAGWVKLIVARFAQEAPRITTWEAYNEPNSVYDSADWYWRTVEIPFADAAHAARAASYVIGGNTLGFAEDWWKVAADDGVCAKVDAIGVHPYTGWNRSWDEEGFPAPDAGYSALSSALGPACAGLPRWDTESGWTADGAVAYWAQGSNVARKLLWNRLDGVAGWTYFFSEGGWGENDLSWSLVQYRSYVKPGGLAFATVSRLLADRGRPTEVATGIPFTHLMRVPGDDELLVAWTDEARLAATMTTDAAAVEVTDQYGATSRVEAPDGRARITLTATPQFLRVPSGGALALRATEGYGPDLLAGQKVAASSTYKDSDPQTITSGTADPGRPWRSGLVDHRVDPAPTVTIPLRSPTTIDRIAVATGNIACCEAGLRGYTVSVQTADGSWKVVARPDDQFWERTVVFRFDPMEAKAVRVQARWTTIRDVKMLDMNYTGFVGGLPPPFMGLQTATDFVMSVSAVQAWAPARPE